MIDLIGNGFVSSLSCCMDSFVVEDIVGDVVVNDFCLNLLFEFVVCLWAFCFFHTCLCFKVPIITRELSHYYCKNNNKFNFKNTSIFSDNNNSGWIFWCVSIFPMFPRLFLKFQKSKDFYEIMFQSPGKWNFNLVLMWYISQTLYWVFGNYSLFITVRT